LIIALLGVVLLGALAMLFRGRGADTPETPAPVVAERSVAPAPAAPPATPSATTTPAPARPAARRAPAATVEAPALEPAPVEAAPETGTLTITSDVPGAQVFLDRAFLGAAPVTARDVKPGSHQLNVSAQGFDAHVETIEVTPGPREIPVRFREVRLSASIDVVHKHRMGSCKGRLVATPQGLRYETTDKDDGFQTTLVDIETFQVDYLNKNLRVQARKGRRYDFTDPEGNADRLFVFHRDVDRARERLKKGDGS
jgi:hypothetical protein